MAYAVSNIEEILKQYLDHHPDLDINNQIQSLLQKSRSWRDVLLRIPWDTEYAIALRNKIIEAAHKTEDVIETHIRNHILQLPPPTDDNHLSDLVQDFESIMEELSEVDEDQHQPVLPLDHLSSNSVPWYPKLDPRSRDDLTYIFQHDFQTLKSQLIHPSKLRIIAIHGATGMGKRTLARRLFNDLEIASRFHTRAWVTSPIGIDEKGCLLNLLEGLGMLSRDMSQKDVEELKAYIRNALKHINYFIAIHDVVEHINLLTFTSLFRDYRVGARVLFTTVESEVLDASIYAEVYKMPNMSNTESWLLLRHKVFGRAEHFPHELENIGNNIVQLCGGNPLLVSLVSGVLATSDKKTPSVSELVATTLDRILDHDEKNIMDLQAILLVIIYYHLPNYLRPCLLYTGAFFESRDIKASKVIKLWIAEGFVKQISGKCLEDVAATYLQILIDKNLLCCTCEEPNGRVKAFQSHIFLRVYFWGLAGLEKFLGSKYLSDEFGSFEEKLVRRVSVHGLAQPCDEMELPLLARSFLSVSGASRPKVEVEIVEGA